MTRRRVLIVLAALVLLLGAAVLAALWMARQRPAWYAPLDAQAPQVRAKAQDVENGVTTMLNAAAPASAPSAPTAPDAAVVTPGTFVMSIKEADANAWLAARLRPWVEHEFGAKAYPARLRGVQVNFLDGALSVAAEFADSSAEDSDTRVITVQAAPEIDAQGQLWLRDASAAVGMMPVPLSMVADRLGGGEGTAPEVRELARAVEGARALGIAQFPRADGMAVKVDRVQIIAGTLTLHCRTVAR